MVEQSVLTSIRNYIAAVEASGVAIERAVVFGSHVSGKSGKWSDIDLIVVSPAFDEMTDRSGINMLWRIAAKVDNRIEPIACGAKQWLEDDSSAIIEIARRHGEVVGRCPR